MEGELQAVVGANLRRLRRRLGYSQENFGELVQWHRTFVGAVERGERNLTLKTIERIAFQLNVRVIDLFDEGSDINDLETALP
ncbi:MAG: helix-turn-helix transcriptional regulator [Acidimicrobiales bacterium]|nr:helix-turn-helix transcriptional regulator [Acidimicrobiales bacterium]